MNPYEADPTKIPATDLYANVPIYGRYKPCPDDFVPSPPPGPSTNDDVIRYWERVILDKCTQANRMYEVEGWRDVFALGSVIVMSSHLSVKPPEKEHALRDANDQAAIAVVGDCLREVGVQVPTVYFQGKINQNDVLVQSRIPGVTLNVAWPYLTQAEKASFKQQARTLIKKLDQLKQPQSMGATAPSYALPAANPVSWACEEVEYDMLFGKIDGEGKLGFAHNDLNTSNIIVQDGKITSLIDWEMAGWFGARRAGEVHFKIRSGAPGPEGNYWDDLYEDLQDA
ncbi:hypothetical protein F5Y13DRAFT_165947 [Hypoxylon sp. FL1857]|nr:hypothetical protein F5Y13DRAFT_165947 [Hypoxylon sp. FL1857]